MCENKALLNKLTAMTTGSVLFLLTENSYEICTKTFVTNVILFENRQLLYFHNFKDIEYVKIEISLFVEKMLPLVHFPNENQHAIPQKPNVSRTPQ